VPAELFVPRKPEATALSICIVVPVVAPSESSPLFLSQLVAVMIAYFGDKLKPHMYGRLGLIQTVPTTLYDACC
jgi:hypothetical protein